MWFWIILIVVVAGLAAYKLRVPLLAKLLGQSDERVQREIERRKRR